MLTKEQITAAQEEALDYINKASIKLTQDEIDNIEVADFGFGIDELRRTGLELVVYENNARYCAKEMVLFPGQTCPEHRHPRVADDPGKMETFRCRWGKVFLYVEGPKTENIQAKVPEGSEDYYTVFNEIVLEPGDQHTIDSGVLHWFQSGPEGAVVSEFSSTSRDETDIFTDPRIKRIPEIAE